VEEIEEEFKFFNTRDSNLFDKMREVWNKRIHDEQLKLVKGRVVNSFMFGSQSTRAEL
jgi:hypothetical protein